MITYGFRTDGSPPLGMEIIPPLPDISVQFVRVIRASRVLVKGRVAGQQDVANHPHGPDVCLASVRVAANHLGRDVSRGAAGRLLVLHVGDSLGKTKVSHLASSSSSSSSSRSRSNSSSSAVIIVVSQR